jgi:hypothetical protein
MFGMFSRLTEGFRKKLESSNSKPGEVWFTPEIVGESFYKDSFKSLRDGLGLKSGAEARVHVDLVQDPSNEHSRSGKAVAVFVGGLKVGHVSNLDSDKTFEHLSHFGGRIQVPGRIYFGDLRETISRNSVTIELSVLRLTSEENQKTIDATLEKERTRNRLEQRTAEWELLKKQFLRNPTWNSMTVHPGDKVTFSGFADSGKSLSKVLASLKGEPHVDGPRELLVLHPNIIESSAKLRDSLGRSKPVTELSTFIANNPEFASADLR